MTVPVLSGVGSRKLEVPHLARKFALYRAQPPSGRSSLSRDAVPGRCTGLAGIPRRVIAWRSTWPGLRRNSAIGERGGREQTVQTHIHGGLVIVPGSSYAGLSVRAQIRGERRRQRPGDPMRMRLRPALKGRNNTLAHALVMPFQGVAFFIVRSGPQGDALGWNVVAPSGRDAKSRNTKTRKRGTLAKAGDVTPPVSSPARRVGMSTSAALVVYFLPVALPITGNGRVARLSLVKRSALGTARQKAPRQKRIRPHLAMQLRVPHRRRNNRKFEESL